MTRLRRFICPCPVCYRLTVALDSLYRHGAAPRVVYRRCDEGHHSIWAAPVGRGGRCLGPTLTREELRTYGPDCAFPGCGYPRKANRGRPGLRFCEAHAKQLLRVGEAGMKPVIRRKRGGK